MPLEKSGRHHTGGGGGPGMAGAGGSCISNTSAPGTEIRTDSAARPGAGLFEGRGGLGHVPSPTIPGVPHPWPGEAKPFSTGTSHLTPGESSSQSSLEGLSSGSFEEGTCCKILAALVGKLSKPRSGWLD